jgi:hypothetical protein
MFGFGCACHTSWLTLLTGVSALAALFAVDSKRRREAGAVRR